MKNAADILYVASHGFAARMVLHSDLVPKLMERGVRIAILSPSGSEQHFIDLCARRGATAIAAPDVGGKLLGEYGQGRRYLFEDFERNAALRSKHQWEMLGPSKPALRARAAFGKAVNSVMLNAPPIPKALATLEQTLLRSRALRSLLEQVQPRLLLATYPVAWLDALAILEAQRLGIPTVGQLLSWDNISCKGRFAAVPDRFISWGPIMTAELREYYGVTDTIETGVAHFDLHTRPVDVAVRREALQRIGLDPDRPYLFVGMSASFFAPHEIDIVTWLAERVRRGVFGREMQLVIRPHPQSLRGPMADPRIIEGLRAVEGPAVGVDLPGVLTDRLDMADDDMPRLAALLHGASVTLNSGSTLSIDALIHRRPVVLTMFDADRSLPWWKSARRLAEFPHLAKLIEHGGVRVASSFGELESLIAGYLREPDLDLAARIGTQEAECGPSDGLACERIASSLASLLDRAKPSEKLPLWRKARRRLGRVQSLRRVYDDAELLLRYRRLSPDKVTLEGGHSIFVDPKEQRGRAILLNGGTGQPGLKRIWRDAIRVLRPTLVIDVGANYGEFIFSTSYEPGVRVLGIEANPLLMAHLERSRDAHEHAANIQLVCGLAAAEPGQPVPFFIDMAWSGRSSALQQTRHENVVMRMVDTVSIDGLLTDRLGSRQRLVFKIDVEGYEPHVIAGMPRTLAASERAVGMLEFNTDFIEKLGLEPEVFLRSLRERFPAIVAFDHDEKSIDLSQRTLSDAFGPGPTAVDLVVATDAAALRELGL